nr:hypothetical protein Iba_chr03dCG8290 [Ipomoea batatas]
MFSLHVLLRFGRFIDRADNLQIEFLCCPMRLLLHLYKLANINGLPVCCILQKSKGCYSGCLYNCLWIWHPGYSCFPALG